MATIPTTTVTSGGGSSSSVPAGTRYESTLPLPTLPSLHTPPPEIKPETLVRPFTSWRERYDQRIAELQNPPGTEEEDPELCIGGQAPSGLTEMAVTAGMLPTLDFRVVDPEDEEPEEGAPPDYTWTEQSRQTRKVRVENPEDSEQYVIVERIERMRMASPNAPPFNGEVHTWIFKNSGRGGA